jgi:hypothetical protein
MVVRVELGLDLGEELRIRLAHVRKLAEDHAELAHLVELAAFALIEGEHVLEKLSVPGKMQGVVSIKVRTWEYSDGGDGLPSLEPADVARLDHLAELVPDREVDAARLVGHPEGPHLFA